MCSQLFDLLQAWIYCQGDLVIIMHCQSEFHFHIHHLHVTHNAPFFPQKNFAYALFPISLGTAVIPRRNEKQRL